ncbi:hypothetical protein [Haloferax sp. DFSO52]
MSLSRSKRVKIRFRSILSESKNSTAKGEYLPDILGAGYSRKHLL